LPQEHWNSDSVGNTIAGRQKSTREFFKIMDERMPIDRVSTPGGVNWQGINAGGVNWQVINAGGTRIEHRCVCVRRTHMNVNRTREAQDKPLIK
jgi:hypothetical protein